MSTVTETEQTTEATKLEPVAPGESTTKEKADAQALLDKISGAGQEKGGGNAITDETPEGQDPPAEETPGEDAELTPRHQKALDSLKADDATKEALKNDPVALEHLATLRTSISRAHGKLGAATRKSKKAAAEEKPVETPAPVVPVAEPVDDDPITEENIYDKSFTAYQAQKKENTELRKQLGTLTERMDARDKGEEDQLEDHRAGMFDDFIADLDPKVYPQYGDGSETELPKDDPALEVRSELLTEYLDLLDDAKARGKTLTEADALNQAFFHIHKEVPVGRPAKPKAKKPTGSVRPEGNPPVRTPKDAEMASAQTLINNYHKGASLK